MNYAMRKQLLTQGNWLLNKKYAKIDNHLHVFNILESHLLEFIP